MSLPSTLQASYEACRRLTKQAGSNFTVTFIFLPKHKRWAMDVLYAFMRRTDDLVDNDLSTAERRDALDRWRNQLATALEDAPSVPREPEGVSEAVLGSRMAPAQDPIGEQIFPALVDTIHRFQIPVEHLLAVIDGVEMDLTKRRYETHEALVEYCARVASAVGLACIYVWGFRDPRALEGVRQCGLAFQWTNILRDLKEDVDEGRIYLPMENLRQYDYSPEDLAAGVADARFVRLVRQECDRARDFYHQGAEVLQWLDPGSHRSFGLMLAIYYRLLEKIERNPAAVLTERIRLSRWEKLRILARWILLPRRSALP